MKYGIWNELQYYHRARRYVFIRDPVCPMLNSSYDYHNGIENIYI